MSTSAAIFIVVAAAVITYAMRGSVIVALGGRRIPAGIELALRNVGPAVLAALTINLAAGGDGGPQLELAEAAALITAAVIAIWRRDLLLTLAAGMIVLWVVSAVA
jgi:branched-subunit amino acid transport protein